MTNVRINTETAGNLRAVAYTPYDQTDLLTRALAKDPETALGAELSSKYATKADYATKAEVGSTYVPLTRTINGQPLSADVTILARRPGFYDIGDVSGEVTIDAANGTTQALTLTGDAAPRLTGDPGDTLVLVVKQDATGSRMITWPAYVTWETVPTLTTTAGSVDVLSLLEAGGYWLGVASELGFVPPTIDSTPPTAGTLTVTPGAETADLSVAGAADETALDNAPYAFSADNGTTYSAWQAAATYTVADLAPETSYTFRHKIRDAWGNETEGTAVTDSTTA